MGDDWEAVLKKEEAKWRKLELESSVYSKRNYIPKVDVSRNPFCSERQLLDQMELREVNKNPALYLESTLRRTGATRSRLRRSGLTTTSPRGYVDAHPKSAVRALNTATMQAHRATLPYSISESLFKAKPTKQRLKVASTGGFFPKREPKKTMAIGEAAPSAATVMSATEPKKKSSRRKPNPVTSPKDIKMDMAPSFGHRPSSASRHFDAFTMNATRSHLKRSKTLPSVPLTTVVPGQAEVKTGDGRRIELLHSEDLAKMLAGKMPCETSASDVAKKVYHPHATAKMLFSVATAPSTSPLPTVDDLANDDASTVLTGPPRPPKDPRAFIDSESGFEDPLGDTSGIYGEESGGIETRSLRSLGASRSRSDSKVLKQLKKTVHAPVKEMDGVNASEVRGTWRTHVPAGLGLSNWSKWGDVPGIRVPKFQVSATGGLANGGYLTDEYESGMKLRQAALQGDEARKVRLWRRGAGSGYDGMDGLGDGAPPASRMMQRSTSTDATGVTAKQRRKALKRAEEERARVLEAGWDNAPSFLPTIMQERVGVAKIEAGHREQPSAAERLDKYKKVAAGIPAFNPIGDARVKMDEQERADVVSHMAKNAPKNDKVAQMLVESLKQEKRLELTGRAVSWMDLPDEGSGLEEFMASFHAQQAGASVNPDTIAEGDESLDGWHDESGV